MLKKKKRPSSLSMHTNTHASRLPEQDIAVYSGYRYVQQSVLHVLIFAIWEICSVSQKCFCSARNDCFFFVRFLAQLLEKFICASNGLIPIIAQCAQHGILTAGSARLMFNQMFEILESKCCI